MKIPYFNITLPMLQLAKPENLVRLAKSLKLDIRGRYHKQIARIIYNRISRTNME